VAVLFPSGGDEVRARYLRELDGGAGDGSTEARGGQDADR
jgi:hypothetical protein